MKKIIASALIAVLSVSLLCSCSDKGDGKTLMYDYRNLSKYIDISDYVGVKVDTKSDEYKESLKSAIESEMSEQSLGTETDITDGEVENGDTVHITYVGKVDGKEFSGGSTGDEGTDLQIGSNSYIEGFESGLVGAKIGSTVTLNLKFPDPYQNNTDLSGKKVEFTVDVQSVKRTSYPELTDEIAVKLGYENLDEYNNYIEKSTAKAYAFNKVVEGSKVKKYPDAEIEKYIQDEIKYYTDYAQSYNTTFADFLKQSNMDEDSFREYMEKNYKDNMAQYLVVYYIAKAEKLTVDKDDLDKKYKEMASEYSTDEATVREKISDEQLEFTMLYDNATDFIYEKAKII